jgi:hypothetical protein
MIQSEVSAMKMMLVSIVGLLLVGTGALVHAAESPSTSDGRTAVLVELFTSEGCSSCPPADSLLQKLDQQPIAGEEMIVLSEHVDYWNHIGWKDPYAKREFSQRQRGLSQLQRASFVYTPQVFVQGTDFRDWASDSFDRAVSRLHAKPAGASLELEILSAGHDAIQVRARATMLDATQADDAMFYVAAYENRLQSQVTAGENSGQLLQHDHVVLEWQGPYRPGEGKLRLPLQPKAKIADSGVISFVQNRHTGEVLQALMLGTCSG